MVNLDSILKSRDSTLPTKVCLVKAMVFAVVMYACESWTIKQAECQRIDAFELGCWRRLLRVPWTARRPNQSILKEISPECSLEGLMLKPKPQYFDHLMWRTDSLEKTLMLGKMKAGGEGDNRGWDGWMASPTWRTWVWVGSGVGKPGVLQSMGSQRIRHDWVTELNWNAEILSRTFWQLTKHLCLNFFRNTRAFSKECRTSPLSQSLVFQMKPNQNYCRFLPIRASSALQNNTKLL